MASKSYQSQVKAGLKEVTLTIQFDPNTPDRLSKAGVGVWDVEAVTADGFRLYVQVYQPAKERPAKTSTTSVVVK